MFKAATIVVLGTMTFFSQVQPANDRIAATPVAVMGPAATLKNKSNGDMTNVTVTNPTIEMMINAKPTSATERLGNLFHEFKEIASSTASSTLTMVTDIANTMYESIPEVDINIIMEDIAHNIKETHATICSDMITPRLLGKDGNDNGFIASLVYDRFQLCPRPKTALERFSEYIQHQLDVVWTTVTVNVSAMYSTYGPALQATINSSYTACARIYNRGVHEFISWTAEEDSVDDEYALVVSGFVEDIDHDSNISSSNLVWLAAAGTVLSLGLAFWAYTVWSDKCTEDCNVEESSTTNKSTNVTEAEETTTTTATTINEGAKPKGWPQRSGSNSKRFAFGGHSHLKTRPTRSEPDDDVLRRPGIPLATCGYVDENGKFIAHGPQLKINPNKVDKDAVYANALLGTKANPAIYKGMD